MNISTLFPQHVTTFVAISPSGLLLYPDGSSVQLPLDGVITTSGRKSCWYGPDCKYNQRGICRYNHDHDHGQLKGAPPSHIGPLAAAAAAAVSVPIPGNVLDCDDHSACDHHHTDVTTVAESKTTSTLAPILTGVTWGDTDYDVAFPAQVPAPATTPAQTTAPAQKPAPAKKHRRTKTIFRTKHGFVHIGRNRIRFYTHETINVTKRYIHGANAMTPMELFSNSEPKFDCRGNVKTGLSRLKSLHGISLL